MQSPPGWLCVLLIVTAMIVFPVLEKKMEKARMERLTILLASQNTQTHQEDEIEANGETYDD